MVQTTTAPLITAVTYIG